jgi:hypothetical protein
MKNLRLIFFLFIFMCLANEMQATQYIIIRQRIWGSYRLIYVPKPKNLTRWYHDSKNDTYYRVKNVFGIPARISSKTRTS